MSSTVFLGNLPPWVTADDIKSWLVAENLVADSVKVIRNPETQESKGFAFIEAPNDEEMHSIIKRFDNAPLEERLLRANPAHPPKGRSDRRPLPGHGAAGSAPASHPPAGAPHHATAGGERPSERRHRGGRKHRKQGMPQTTLAEELAKAL
ncbi:MAG: RNA-binding protein [Bryobacteraceae bacterium]|jgi:RNA recognition motif-containing protein|nr:RNA-binding protein [Bryobacteraceae bacterium]